MQQFASTLAFAFCLATSTAGHAAYLIKLKNGNEFVTARYWQEGNQVLFDTHGGVFGVDRALVSKIEQTNKPLKEPAPLEPPQAKTSPAQVKDGKEQKKPPAAEAKTPTARDADPIFKDFDALKHKAITLEGMSTSELQEFLKDLTSLRRRIQASGRSNDYLREFGQISEMGDAAEARLRSKR